MNILAFRCGKPAGLSYLVPTDTSGGNNPTYIYLNTFKGSNDKMHGRKNHLLIS